MNLTLHSARLSVDWKRLKFIFCWVFAVGLAAHGFCYFNGNFSHDSLFSLYEDSPETNIAVGRFLRPVYRLIRGNLALPVVNGVLSLVFLALAIYLLTEIVGMRRRSFIALTCALQVTSVSFTLMNATYIHDADAYMLSLLITMAGIWASLRLRRGLLYATVLYLVSLGIYQAYVNVAIYIFLVLALVRLLKGERVRQVYGDTLRCIVPILVSMVLYYLCVRLTQYVTNVSGNDLYNGLPSISELTLGSIFERLYICLYSEAVWLLVPSGYSTAVVRIVNILMLLAAAWMAVSILLARRLPAASVWGILGILAAIPFGMNAITIIWDMYHSLTLYALYLSYVWVLVLAELCLSMGLKSAKWQKLACSILAGVLVFDGCLFSNRSYLKKELENAATLSTFTRIISRMEATPGFVPGQTRVAFVGVLLDSPLTQELPGFCYADTGMYNSYSTTYHDTCGIYLSYYLGYPVDWVDHIEIAEFEEMEEVAEMPLFPAEGSVRMVGDVMVVKFSEPKSAKEE